MRRRYSRRRRSYGRRRFVSRRRRSPGRRRAVRGMFGRIGSRM